MLKIGNDVHRFVLEILPRVPVGVAIHIHDIFWPYEYPREWILDFHHFWDEQYVLQAFLTYNDRFQVMLCNSYLHVRHPDLIARGFPHYVTGRTWPGSLWIERTR